MGTEDAVENSPPAILAVRTAVEELAEPGPVVLDTGSLDTLSIDLLDTDVNDTLYVRVFVDYNHPNIAAPRSTCKAGVTDSSRRTASCAQQGICLSTDVDRDPQPIMTVLVFDREVSDAGTIPYQTMTDPAGITQSRTYLLTCRQGGS